MKKYAMLVSLSILLGSFGIACQAQTSAGDDALLIAQEDSDSSAGEEKKSRKEKRAERKEKRKAKKAEKKAEKETKKESKKEASSD